MYIDNINKFLENYKNINQEAFLKIINNSNTKEFNIYKFEKDFLLTLILVKFGEKYPDLIFKGGTCLNKVYFPYFRLSELLSFRTGFGIIKNGLSFLGSGNKFRMTKP